MKSELIGEFKRKLRNFRSNRILNKIGAGKVVYFENPIEAMALKYIPGRPGELGRYYAKHYGQNEYEINFDSTSILMGVMEGRQIRKSLYEKYHLIENAYWIRKIKAHPLYRAVS